MFSQRVISYRFFLSLLTISLILALSESLVTPLLAAYQDNFYVVTCLQEAVIRSFLLVLISAPMIWFFVLYPLVVQINQGQKLIQGKLNAEFHNALDAHALVAITDAQGIITYANDTFCQVSGYSLQDVLGKKHSLVSSGYHDDGYIKSVWESITQGNIWQGVFCNRRKDGSLYWTESTITPIHTDAGVPYQYVSISQDITAKKILNEELVLFKRAVDSCCEMILLVNAEGNIQYANSALCEQTGWANYCLVGLKPNVLDSENVDTHTIRDMKNTLDKKQPWTGRLLVRRKISAASHFANQLTPRAFDAPEFWVELTITPILNRDGSVAGYLQIQHDITEQLLKEANQQRAKKDSSTVVINRDVYSQAA
ncbi:MAG: PAS domain S-box protein [Methylococcaceae bacterium]